jgi:serine/threonine-protein phosphatase 2A activator
MNKYFIDQAEIPPSSIVPTTSPPKPLPPTNLYNLSISRIHQVKSGPFHEHSSQLHSIAVGVQGGWKKVNGGLWKMYEVSPNLKFVGRDAKINLLLIIKT